PQRALPAHVRPPARSRRRGDPALRGDARGARLPAAPAAGARARDAAAPVATAAGRRAAARKKPERDAVDDLRAVLRKVKRGDGEVVAGPWLGSEVEELLYWIPFLRWAQTATFGLRDRLTVVARASSAAWYDGIGARHADAADWEGATTIEPELIERLRDELAAGDPQAPFSRRRLEFPAGRSDGEPYVGPWGVEAVLALLAGREAVVDTLPAPRDRTLVDSFFPGRLRLAELAQV